MVKFDKSARRAFSIFFSVLLLMSTLSGCTNVANYPTAWDETGESGESAIEASATAAQQETSEGEPETATSEPETGLSEPGIGTAEPGIGTPKSGDASEYGEIYYAPVEEEHVTGEGLVKYVNNEILIAVKDGVSREQVGKLAQKYQCEIVGEIEVSGDYQLRFSKEIEKEELVSLLSHVQEEFIVSSASLNYVAEVSEAVEKETFKEFYFGKEWQSDLQNYNDCQGLSWGFEAINVIGAWNQLSKTKRTIHPVKVGLIDSGFDANHEDLKFAEILYDNGANGLTSEGTDHGTHVAGTIAAKCDDTTGICGVYPYGAGQLYGVAACGQGVNKYNSSTMAEKIAFAELIVRDVKVINSSRAIHWNENEDFADWYDKTATDEHFEDFEEAADAMGDFFRRMLRKGYDFVIVSAAGNNSNGLRKRFDTRYAMAMHLISYNKYPEVYNRIIVVGAVNEDMNVASYSDGGSRVDIYAPGGESVGPYSTLPNNTYGYMVGTSMAAPHVAGVAAMVWSANSSLTGAEVKAFIMDRESSKCTSCRMVDAGWAVSFALEKEDISSTAKAEKGGVLCYVVEQDNESRPIEYAQITLTNVTTKEKYNSMTDAEGHFEIMVPEGKYQLSVKAIGYEDYEWSDNPRHISPIEVQSEQINYLDDWIKLKRSPNVELPQTQKTGDEKVKAGDVITFGRYPQTADGKIKPVKWEVLDVEDGKALIISKRGLDGKPYNNKLESVTWETCSLRAWLNNDFLNTAFTQEEQNLIFETEVIGQDNPKYVQANRGKNTMDKVFLLSFDETLKYFHLTKNEGELIDNVYCYGEMIECRPTEWAIAAGVQRHESGYGDDYSTYTISCPWWLRSPGMDNYSAATWWGTQLSLMGNTVDSDYFAVRPTLWIDYNKLSPDDICSAELYNPSEEEEPVQLPDLSSVAVGDVITLGKMIQDSTNLDKPIEWQVLDVKDGKALVISRLGLTDVNYNAKDVDVTWETCTLRERLNGLFLTSTFAKEEQELILETKVSNPDNPNYGTKGGNDTTDRLFLLSMDEVLNYFHMTKNSGGGNTYCNGDGCACMPTQMASSDGWNDEYEECWWWLRTPGNSQSYAMVAHRDYVSAFGSMVDRSAIALRPAMWIKISQ